jgi:hypothetical protein
MDVHRFLIFHCVHSSSWRLSNSGVGGVCAPTPLSNISLQVDISEPFPIIHSVKHRNIFLCILYTRWWQWTVEDTSVARLQYGRLFLKLLRCECVRGYAVHHWHFFLCLLFVKKSENVKKKMKGPHPGFYSMSIGHLYRG